MSRIQKFQSQDSQILARVTRPRFLGAIPSLVVLTTAMAWGASSNAGVLGLDGVLRTKAGVTVATSPVLGGGVKSGVTRGR
ncbi:hypothetical protein [Polaromonas sp. UBA4122]|uniref:hypothetical protein n=1 Tax=Polaromonas sp. UBA4122 TaxID=1947074 RepID=UPI0025EC1A7A|nr:hypothetical protein [Polaromonas sp. UBA4122]